MPESFAPLIKIVSVFVLMMAGIRLRLGIGVSILTGSLALNFLFGKTLMFWFKTAADSLSQEETLYLSGIVAVILILSDVLEKTGQTQRVMDNIGGYMRGPRMRLVFFPALIGLLPMPGGAGFSAPLVQGAAEPLGVDASSRSLINYWFRHPWELCWPLYPGVILAASIAEMPLTQLIGLTLPGFFISFALGWYYYLRPTVLPLAALPPDENLGDRNPREALRHAAPLLIAIIGSAVFEAVVGAFLPDQPFELGIIAALILAIACSAAQNRVGWALTKEILLQKHLYLMLFIVAAILIFKGVLIDSGAVEALAKMGGGKTALFIAATFIPYCVGMISGITMAFVGSSFPLILGLLSEMGLNDQRPAYVVLALFSGYAGVMGSPLHICFIFSCHYFKADLSASWRRIVKPSLAILAAGVAYFFLLTM
jgi:uncharacterized protein